MDIAFGLRRHKTGRLRLQSSRIRQRPRGSRRSRRNVRSHREIGLQRSVAAKNGHVLPRLRVEQRIEKLSVFDNVVFQTPLENETGFL